LATHHLIKSVPASAVTEGCQWPYGSMGNRRRRGRRQGSSASTQRSWRRPQTRRGWPLWPSHSAGCKGIPSRRRPEGRRHRRSCHRGSDQAEARHNPRNL